MAQDSSRIVELDPALLDGPNNNRTDYKYVKDLAQSIKAIGQTQPIEVVALPTGRYEIVSGHTRTLACKQLGIKVRAVLLPDNLTARERYARTLAENDARQDTNDIEKAAGYKRAIDEHGYTVEELARQIGKRVDYVDRRLSLLALLPEYQHMIATGNMPLGFGVAMSTLTPEYQYAAVARINEYTKTHGRGPDIHWFRAQCADLQSKQDQLGLFSFGHIETREERQAAVQLPADPADYRPSFNPLDLEDDIARQLEKWRAAGRDWAVIGNSAKAAQCNTIVQSLNAFSAALDMRRQAAALDNERQEIADKVTSLLEDRGAMTAADLYRYANMAKNEIMPVLEHMVRIGRIAEHKAGRGYRYSLAV